MPLTPGSRLGPYEIVAALGAGGMGEVYRARDTRLGREVAVKVLPQHRSTSLEMRARFEREARTVSSLNHPHICVLHDVGHQDGVDFLVMELVAGTPLDERLKRGALPEAEVCDLGSQIAEALEAAHELGIIHRDLKPANVMLTAKGQVKVLDFGLARLLLPLEGADLTKSLTEAGVAVGTLPYMAPEQLLGRKVDGRADLYSLGVVLYELATGKSPYKEKIPTALVYEIVNQPVTAPRQIAPQLSPRLEAIIMNCLEKDPQRRYPSARALIDDLRSGAPVSRRRRTTERLVVAGAAAAAIVLAVLVSFDVGGLRSRLTGVRRIESLAVLPLENLSADPEQEYFAEGMTDELTTTLAQLGGLRVISRTSALHYRRSDKPLRQIARELNVDAVLEGSVVRSGDRVRITAQLIRAATDQHLWAGSYDRELRDVLRLQGDVAQAVAREIRITLTPSQTERLTRPRRIDPEAHEAYLKGRYFWLKRTDEGVKRGLAYFQQAIEHDPGYALAYAGLADAYDIAGTWGFLPATDAYPKAKAAAMRAMEIDSTLAESHAALGIVLADYDWDWVGCVRELRRAVELNPNDAPTHLYLANHLVGMGEFEEGVAEAKRAVELDPLSTFISTRLAAAFLCARRFDEAIVQARKTLDLDSTWGTARSLLGDAYLGKGMELEAVREYLKREAIAGGDPRRIEAKRRAFETGGMTGYWRAQLAASLANEPSAHNVTELYARLGDKDHAFALLGKAYEARSTMFLFSIKSYPAYDNLRSDPRYAALLSKLPLTP